MAKHILLVEDDQMLAEMFIDKFRQMDFTVDLALTAEQAISFLKKRPKLDLILLDMLLPKKNGTYLLKKIKQEPHIPQVPIIVISNYQDPKTIQEAYQLGIEEYLLKTDYTPAQLIKKVEDYFQNKGR